MGLVTFSLNLTPEACIDHREGIADNETHAFFTRLMDEYLFLVHPRIAGHGSTLIGGGFPATRRLKCVSTKPLRHGAMAMRYRCSRSGARVVHAAQQESV